MGVRYKLIRTRVEELLRQHKISEAPVNVALVAEALGATIVQKPTDENLSGFLLRDRGRVVIGVNARHPKNRQRFTVAHEIGHFLLHEGTPLYVDGDAKAFSLDRRDERSSDGSDVREREANLFAAELLMPASFLKRDLDGKPPVDLLDPKEKSLERLARKYGVSVQALTFRLANLDLIHL